MKYGLKIALVQGNFTVGDIAGNLRRLREALTEARAMGAQMLVTPEMALSGYPPEDWLEQPDFHVSHEAALAQIQAQCDDVALVLGHVEREEGCLYNAASVFHEGRRIAHYRKRMLPNYGVFDEARHFVPGDGDCMFEFAGQRIALAICEDLWAPGHVLMMQSADLTISLNASPFDLEKHPQRLAVLRGHARALQRPVVYCNLVGGQDELLFDGRSFVLDADGRVVWEAAAFAESVGCVLFSGGRMRPVSPSAGVDDSPMALLHAGLTLAVRDYVKKNGFSGVLVGLSGGIDSALTLTLAVDALGADHVRAVMMASPYTARMSLDDSRALARNLGVRYNEIPIEPAMRVFEHMLAADFAGLPVDAAEENIQSRIRGLILMALSNKHGGMVLATGNKSEMATGYATLYGDMAGGFALLKDVYKTQVFALAHWINRNAERIPENILLRPPSAELRPDQKDEDSLPPYSLLDTILAGLIERRQAPESLIADGLPAAEVNRVARLLRRAEYKRRQAPPGPRVSTRSFGRDWRFPITAPTLYTL